MRKTCNVKSKEKCKRSDIHPHTYNRVGTATAAIATTTSTINNKGIHFKENIVYAKSKVERKSLWLKCLGKIVIY